MDQDRRVGAASSLLTDRGFAQMAELEEALKKANAELFQAKADRIDLEAQNSMLRVREQEDRQKIQHLLALTQPITEEVGELACECH